MKLITRLLPLAVLFLVVPALRANPSLDHARQAQALLGPEVWSQVVRIENAAPSARYPRVVHALVFEVAGVLWFYTDTEGTQSFSLHRGRLAPEKADFAPLLRDISPGFMSWTVVAGRLAAPAAHGTVPNGCFIASIAALRDRLLRGGEVVRPQLLSYYVTTATGLAGHTVLAYETRNRVEIVDSGGSGQRLSFPAPLAHDALKLARAMEGGRVARARLLPVDWPTARAGYYSTFAAAAPSAAGSG